MTWRKPMHVSHRFFGTLLLGIALVSTTVGCARPAIYDPYYHDYHHWDSHEVVYYQRWEVETRREHRDFERRGDDEHKEYWTWRHSHEDHH
jgi:hypothetical protein